MAGDYLHGVEHFFLENQNRPIEVLPASVIGLVATANDADAAIFPLNKPVLVKSESFMAKAGVSGSLRAALADIYRQGGALVVVVRVAEEAIEADQIAAVIGSIDNENNTFTGIKALLSSEAVLGLRPRLIIAPEFSQLPAVGAELEVMAKKLNGTPLIDGDHHAGYAAVIAQARLYGEGAEAYFLNGGLVFFDPVKKQQVERFMSATVAGVIARVDNEEGYWNSPSNRKIYGVLGTVETIDHTIGSSTSKANLYNQQHVTVAVNQQGGWYLWGNRLSHGTMLPHQRIRYIVGDSILYAHQAMLDRNVTKGYVDGVKNRVNNLLRRLISRSVISGGECWLDNELNVAAIGTGQVYWDYDLGFFDVAERMTFRQHVTDRYNQAIFS
ncbi:phage tail sheath subtilisin-like domain-containing protein [Shewanella sp. VB17]|uniref:phage tail sheath subtilisin-like domain-containing protein n=1 Tax=Shewanella sp. VB17 TaxID=2739432 RepID=UPI001567AC32|nr:phage tail sheath subtilisin-like domain-containing protein [Shewanella sp. VB17]NRD72720.1 phage tail sheath subtilisin-like domain-containing protein [Shewanella sp. VB17]